jgi:hypothetical protein
MREVSQPDELVEKSADTWAIHADCPSVRRASTGAAAVLALAPCSGARFVDGQPAMRDGAGQDRAMLRIGRRTTILTL